MADVYQLDGAPKGGHWHLLRPSRNLGQRMKACLVVGLIWESIAVVTALSRMSHGVAAASGGTIAFVVVALLIGLVPLGEALRVFLMYRHLEDARISINRRELVLGQSFHVKVEQPARKGLKIQDMKIALVCVEEQPQGAAARSGSSGGKGKDKRSLVRVEKWEKLTANKDIDHAKMLSATRKFAVPPEQLPSSPATQTKPPYIRWKLRLVTAPVHGPAYDVEFPVQVYATPSGPSFG